MRQRPQQRAADARPAHARARQCAAPAGTPPAARARPPPRTPPRSGRAGRRCARRVRSGSCVAQRLRVVERGFGHPHVVGDARSAVNQGFLDTPPQRRENRRMAQAARRHPRSRPHDLAAGHVRDGRARRPRRRRRSRSRSARPATPAASPGWRRDSASAPTSRRTIAASARSRSTSSTRRAARRCCGSRRRRRLRHQLPHRRDEATCGSTTTTSRRSTRASSTCRRPATAPQGPDADVGRLRLPGAGARRLRQHQRRARRPADPGAGADRRPGRRAARRHRRARRASLGRERDGRGMQLRYVAARAASSRCSRSTSRRYLFTRQLRTRQFRGGSRPFWRDLPGQATASGSSSACCSTARGPTCAASIGREDLLADERFDYVPQAHRRQRRRAHRDPRRDVRDGTCARVGRAPEPRRHVLAADPGRTTSWRPTRRWSPTATSTTSRATTAAILCRLVGSGIAFDGEPMRIERLAPHHGEHTEDVLLEAGYSWDEIEAMCRDGAAGPVHHDGKGA